MLFGVIGDFYISCTMRWEVSLVGRNTITHGGSVGPATKEDSVPLSETTNWSNCSNRYLIVRCSILNRKSGVDFLLDSPMNPELFGQVFGPVRSLFEVGPEVDIQMYCRPVVVVQVLVVVRCRCSPVLLFGVRCSAVFSRSCSIASELLGLCSTRSAQYETAMATEGLFVYLYDF